MKVSPTITLQEMVSVLRESLTQKLGHEVEEITVTSYDKPVLHIDAYDMVQTEAIRHRARE